MQTLKKIKSIVIENTSLCGAKCIMCPRGKIKYYYGEMSMKLYKKAIFEAVELGVINFGFCALGDPLMDTKFEERLIHIKENYPYAKIGVTTTGHLLNSKSMDLICKYVDKFKISNYGFSKKTYESVHGGVLKYEDVFRNIDDYLNRSDRPYTTLCFLDLLINHDELEAWKSYYEPKTDQIDIWSPHNWAGLKGDAPQSTNIKPCHRALELDNLIIRANGMVSLCCFSVDNGLILGNMESESLSQIISNDKVAEIQNIHKNNQVLKSNLPCRTCDQIHDRSNALLYTNDKTMKVGKYSLFHE